MILKSAISFMMTLVLVLVCMPKFITYMKKLSIRQSISEYSLEEDQKKAGTPIMGGILFILIPILVTLVVHYEVLTDSKTMIVILAFAGYGCIGFIDDYLIAVKKNNDGLKPKYKLLMQLVLGVVFFYIYSRIAELELVWPITHHVSHLGFFYFLLVLVMFSGSSNAVNLTDGMDGLSSGCSIIALFAFAVISVLEQQFGIMVLIINIIAGLFGYLYYNKKPAQVFMGDTGSLALGGLLAALAMVLHKEIALIFIGGIFVLDTLSVIIQISSVKIRHKKVFIYTPIHFAFRIKGMPETQVVHMFWFVEAILAGIGLLLAIL